MPYVESLEEFSARQKSSPLHTGGRYLYPNGAQSDGYEHYEAPDDPAKVAVLRHEYYRARLAKAIHQYNSERNVIETQTDFHRRGVGPMPPDGWEKRLADMAKRIRVLQWRVDRLAQCLPQSQAWNAYDEHRAEYKARAAEAIAKLHDLPTFAEPHSSRQDN